MEQYRDAMFIDNLKTPVWLYCLERTIKTTSIYMH